MQRLLLEDKWKKTISNQDLDIIEKVFNQTKTAEENEQIRIVPIRFAVNHRKDLLCITLIHNYAETNVDLTKVEINIRKNDEILASHLFEENRLQLDAKTSMPWTFIFPEDVIGKHDISGELSIDINYWKND
ncbi:SLAP domain-containing protein [Gracilibacillus ureilyticus]|uniref:SLAP domain-containing protein n=1 Tax=Gracilibacillus ureilyticus TaxID=531814 RepID=A0A1H9Q9P4_9BACI|nr:SLAP domain-containing protein [Gracilibacillus ureilyticus]SER57160.1 SLAP domain-containing protein [Gracilibacillus ureilyticus]